MKFDKYLAHVRELYTYDCVLFPNPLARSLNEFSEELAEYALSTHPNYGEGVLKQIDELGDVLFFVTIVNSQLGVYGKSSNIGELLKDYSEPVYLAKTGDTLYDFTKASMLYSQALKRWGRDNKCVFKPETLDGLKILTYEVSQLVVDYGNELYGNNISQLMDLNITKLLSRKQKSGHQITAKDRGAQGIL